MKKFILIIFAYAMCTTLPSNAVITTDDASSMQYIKKHGYSDEMCRLIDLQHSQYNGTEVTYKNNEPDYYTKNKFVNHIRKIFLYFDPGLDDHKFMEHDTRYSPGIHDL